MIQSLDTAHLHARFSLVDVVPVQDHSFVHHLFSFKVISWSMFPTILKGDLVKIRSADQIRIGDVVVFQQMGALVCHRVTDLGANGEICASGNHAQGSGSPILPQDVVGKVSAIIRGGKKVPLTVSPKSSTFGFIWMKVDLFRTEIRHRLLSLVLRGVEFLKQSLPVRQAFSFALRKLVRVSIGVRAPVRSILAYRFIPLRRFTPQVCCAEPFPSESQTTHDLIVVAHLGRYPLATLDTTSDEVRVYRAATGLGLEKHLRHLYRRIRSTRASSRS